MKVLVATDKPFASIAIDGIRKEIEQAGYELVLLEKYGEKAKLLEAVKDANAIIIRSDVIDAEVLEAAKELKIVVRAGAGYDNVDLEAATAKGVCVMNITQCGNGEVNMDIYETGVALQEIGVISGKDMTTEAATAKMMYVLANERGTKRIAARLKKNLCGEIGD